MLNKKGVHLTPSLEKNSCTFCPFPNQIFPKWAWMGKMSFCYESVTSQYPSVALPTTTERIPATATATTAAAATTTAATATSSRCR